MGKGCFRVQRANPFSQIVPAIALFVVAGLICGCNRDSATSSSAPEPPVEVNVARPFKGAIARNITLPGEVKAYQQATLYAKVAGYLKTIAVDKGDQVKEGALLAEIEVPELISDRVRYQAEVEVARIDFQRLSDSQKKAPDLVVPQAVDNARARLDVAQANLERIETLLNFAKIIAPFPGVITRRMVDPGAFIPAATSGSAAQTAAIVTLSDFNRVRVQVAVPELETSRVSIGQAARLSVESLPGKAFDGKITRFAYALDDATRTMLAEIELPNPGLELRPGMYAAVKISIEQKPDAWLLPADAVVIERAGASAFTVADQKAKKIRIQTGFNDGTNVEILSGVNPDQSVIVVGKRAFADGQPVKISEAK